MLGCGSMFSVEAKVDDDREVLRSRRRVVATISSVISGTVIFLPSEVEHSRLRLRALRGAAALELRLSWRRKKLGVEMKSSDKRCRLLPDADTVAFCVEFVGG